MATQPEWGKNRHNRLLEDGQALAGRHMRTLGQMVDEVGVQVTQSRPRLDKVATLLAKATKEGARMEALLAELQSLVAGMKARRSEVDELREKVEEMERRMGDASEW